MYSTTEEIIEVNVEVDDETRVVFRVSKGVLCRTCDFFQTRVKPEWSAQRRGVPILVKHPEITPQVFSAYVEWLYDGEVWEFRGINQWGPYPVQTHTALESYARAYILGDYLDDSTYREAIIKKFADLFERGGGSCLAFSASAHEETKKATFIQTIKIIWEWTPEASKFRRLIIDLVVGHLDAVDLVVLANALRAGLG